ncbi:response regulator [Candidatus Uabimicrobium sp. HlEnr_7]|uniref:response regulator n=1 Tax=Candidatus Uabimicrobium helgolandensis TaxID=3095367 RepID=UPI003558BAFF
MNREKELEKKIAELEQEIAQLKRKTLGKVEENTIQVPDKMKGLFQVAQNTVGEYFRKIEFDPRRALITVEDERYLLVRASSLSFGFLESIQRLYEDRGQEKALQIGLDFLFDISHVIGIEDAKNFHEKMCVEDPLSKLSAGPIHFAYTGWAFVEILKESNPVPNDGFYLKYRHPYSFEASSWIRAEKKAQKPICIMNAGYSSGWCEQSFGIPLTAVEISCRAQGDEHCTFVMAPPHKISEYIHEKQSSHSYHIPVFLDRKVAEEKLKNAKKKLEQANEMKSLFLANMSHEIRTPMNAIVGFCDLLEDTKLNTEQQNYIRIIKNSSDLLISLIDDLLDMSVIEFGKVKLREVKVDINTVVNQLVQLLQPQFQKKSLHFTYNFLNEAPCVLLGDHVRIQQIFLNLLNNAIKFTPKNGKISLEIFFVDKDDFVVLNAVVEDNGIGIPTNKYKQIFERFSRVDMSFNRSFDGAGLGLAIVKHLVEYMEGSIKVESQEKKGSRFIFHIKLPKISSREEEFVNEIKQELEVPENTSVLIVEDDSTNQKILELILHYHHYKIDIANNGKEAVAKIQQKNYDIVLMDISMPKMNGLDATREIRRLGFSMPIIALTAHVMMKEREKGLSAGMNDYISKPVDKKLLLEKVIYYTNVHKTRDKECGKK